MWAAMTRSLEMIVALIEYYSSSDNRSIFIYPKYDINIFKKHFHIHIYRSSNSQAKSPGGSSFGIDKGDSEGRPSSTTGGNISGVTSKDNPSVSICFVYNKFINSLLCITFEIFNFNILTQPRSSKL